MFFQFRIMLKRLTSIFLTKCVVVFVLLVFFLAMNASWFQNRSSEFECWTNLNNSLHSNETCVNPPHLLDKSSIQLEDVANRYFWLKEKVVQGPDCRSRETVAIIVPYKNRSEHLSVFLHHIHPFLKHQQVRYGIFVVEQSDDGPFNRAKLMNVGFKEALKLVPFDCFIFHDVDLLPEDGRNLYNCPKQPRHMSVAIDEVHYRLPYEWLFGGVSAMTKEQFEQVNGFSNSFWGWGGEDDDMSNRLTYHNLSITRYSSEIARYQTIIHKKATPNPKRFEMLYSGAKRFDTDGLNNLTYQVKKLKINFLYTWLLVNITIPYG